MDGPHKELGFIAESLESGKKFVSSSLGRGTTLPPVVLVNIHGMVGQRASYLGTGAKDVY